MPQLDSLRAAAVTVVMLWHFTSRDTPAREFAVNSGVRLFFVLSGFLITSLLLNARDRRRSGLTAGAAAKNFYIRRTLRIFPVYYGTLIIAAALGVKAVTESFWWFATYLADIRLAATGGTTSVSHLWSLAVEEQFYLVWPWVVLTASTRQLRRVCVIVIVAAPLFRMLTVLVGYPRFGDLLMFGQLDALGAGALLGIYRHEQRLPEMARRSLLGCSIAAVTLAFLFAPGLASMPSVAAFTPTAVAWLMVAPVAYAALGVPGLAGRVLAWRPIRYLGRISYGLYVYHPFMAAAVVALGGYVGIAVPRTGIGAVLCPLVASVIVGAASWHLIERPIGKLRSRLTGQTGVVTLPVEPASSA